MEHSSSVGNRGFLRLSVALGGGGLFASITTATALIRDGAGFYNVSAFAASFFLFASNLYFFLKRPVTVVMQQGQAYTLLALALISSFLSNPSGWGPHVLAALAVGLLIKYRGLRSWRSVLFTAGLAFSAVVVINGLRPGAAITNVVNGAVVFVGAFALVYFAFYDELVTVMNQNKFLMEMSARRVATVGKLQHALKVAAREYNESLAKTKELAGSIQKLQTRIETLERHDGGASLEKYNLTNREIDVLTQLVSEKGSNKDIGDSLGISEGTVKTHLYRICNKVGVDTRVDLIDRFYWTVGSNAAD